MKLIVLISIICLSLTTTACGGDDASKPADSSTAKPITDSSESRADQKQAETLTEVTGTKEPPKVRVPSGPPPTELVVRDLRRGSGAVAAGGKLLRTQFIGVNYKTGKTFEIDWGKTGPFSFVLGSGEAIKGWEAGLKGMKVGGLRELTVPSRLAYETGPLIFVVELLAVE